MECDKIINDIYSEVKSSLPEGRVADYIPELAKINPDKFGIALLTIKGESFAAGDVDEIFSIQSISKVFLLAMAFSAVGEDLWKRVGVEPSGNTFNSIVQLEYEKGIPRNPLINPGAHVLCDILLDELEDPYEALLDFVRKISGNRHVEYNEKVFKSEKNFGYRNASLINMMKSYGNIHNHVDAVLDFYYHACSIELSCQHLTRAFLPFANISIPFDYNDVTLTKSQIKRINAIMLCCGFYDESGEFAFEVGLPGKSGVGGGIVAINPGQYSVATWSPRINPKGNSVFGMRALEMLTSRTENSIF
ncbi:MAG: glutaminase [Sphingobacteriia bacterium]|nr:glutaminase [Sphingobacteriia bacterium]